MLDTGLTIWRASKLSGQVLSNIIVKLSPSGDVKGFDVIISWRADLAGEQHQVLQLQVR